MERVMWDFSIGKAVGMILRTLPFIVLRLIVYVGIALAYLVAVGFGAGIGFVIGHAWADPSARGAGAFWGGLAGFGLTSAILYLAREYLLYLVKAAHIAVMVELYDNHPVPMGQSQIGFGTQFVKSHFAETSILFGVDQVVKGVLRVIIGTLNTITSFIPIPALQTLMRMIDAVIRMSLTYVDEVILAYLIRTRTANPWDTARDGLILYAQNYKHFLKNAVWLSLFMWGVTLVIFLVLIAPAGALLLMFPGHLGGLWALGFAIIFAIALKKALLEPLAIAALMEVFFKTIEGQSPDPEWKARLDTASRQFGELGQKASEWIPRPAVPLPSAKP
jgi:hypothetical protein